MKASVPSSALTADDVRAQVRGWLEEHWDPDLALVEWRKSLVASGWAVPSWPERWHGRGLPAWTLVAWTLILICFFFMPLPRPDPGLQPVNINYVYGFSDTEEQHWMPRGAWVVGLMILKPLLLYVPVHFLLRRTMPKPVSAW